MTDNPIDVTLQEMLEAMSYYRDDEVFRWFQESYVAPDGSIQPLRTLRLTFGEIRRALVAQRPST